MIMRIKLNLLLLAVAISGIVQAQTNYGKYAFDGHVNAIATAADGSIYIAGEFSSVGLHSGKGVAIDANTGAWDDLDVKVEGDVYCAIAIPPSLGGGWYIGGNFTSINSRPRSRFARINSDGTLHPSKIGFTSYVYALAFDSYGNLYVGGSFTPSGSTGLRRLAKVNPSGDLANFYPNVSGTVHTIVTDANGNVYIGGAFTSINGITRNRLAKFDSAGNLASFDPNMDGVVNALTIDGAGNLYAGGFFSNVSGVPRTYLAQFDSLENLTPFNPVINNRVRALAVDTTGNLFALGDFQTVNGVSRMRLAKFDNTGNLTSFNPSFNVIQAGAFNSALAINSSGELYVGGSFTSVSGTSRTRLAKFDSTGVLTSLNPLFDGSVLALALDDSGNLFVGGQFNTIGGTATRSKLAKLDSAGVLTSFNAGSISVFIYSLLVDSLGNIFIGGTIISVNGIPRGRIAKLDSSGNLLSFNPSINFQGIVYAMAMDSNGNLYAGGTFNTVNGVTRNNLCKFDSAGGLLSFNPDINGEVRTLAIDGNDNLYVGGNFTSASGLTRNNMVKFDNLGSITSFDPNLNNRVYAIAIDGNDNVYAGGNFTSVGGVVRNRMVKFDSNGTLANFNPNITTTVTSLLLDDYGNVYAGGNFTMANGIGRSRIAQFSNSGALTMFDARVSSGYVTALALDANGNLLAGGEFLAGYAKFVSCSVAPATLYSITPGASCGPGQVTLSATASPNVDVLWCTDSTGGCILSSYVITTFTTNWISSTTTYYVALDNGICVDITPIMAIIGTSTPNAPGGIPNQSLCFGATVADLSATGLGVKWYTDSVGGTLLAVTDTLTNGTSYYASQTVNGCESTNRLQVTALLNNSTSGTDVRTACDSYTWIDGNTYNANNNTATYNLVGGNVNGCDSLVTLNLTIHTVDNTVGNNSPTLSSNANGATYQWIDCNNGFAPIFGETNQSFTASANGNYAVVVTQNGCTDTSSCVLVNNVGIEENQANAYDLSIFPNPSDGLFVIEYDYAAPVQIEVMTTDGKLVLKQELTEKSNLLDLSHLPKGIYYLHLTFGNSQKTTRRVILR
jgi:hypothetical protein